MKKTVGLLLLSTVMFFGAKAQSEEKETKEHGFKKENLFTGGSVGLGFGSGSFSLGLAPYFGYSLNKYVDVAVGLDYEYISQRDYFEGGDKLRQSVIGPFVFTRIYPVKFLFAHAEYRQNFITQKYFPGPNGYYLPFKDTKSVGSFLIGPGFASGRGEDNKTFFYLSVLFDVAKNQYSPYVDSYGRLNPVFQTGVNIALFQGKSTKGGRFGRNRDRDRY